MFIVTDVSPYPSGPAGVHGVLPQAAVALTELAELASLERCASMLSRRRSGRAGERWCPGAVHHRGDPVDRRAARRNHRRCALGPPRDPRRPCRHRRLHVVGGVRVAHRSSVRRAPWTETFDIDVDVDHPSTRHLGAVWRWRDEVYLFRDLRPDARVLLRVADGQLDHECPQRAATVDRLPSGMVLRRGARPCVLQARSDTSPARGRPPTISGTSRVGWRGSSATPAEAVTVRPGGTVGARPAVMHLVDTVEVEGPTMWRATSTSSGPWGWQS